ncbi:beta-lactamase [Streptomyces zinciresistens K42]|uniref:Beta-lactamase n=1 Tax=Streptomyces zinciresistens K42 TaxID=700597 RepID=G2GIM3_9ACTN|nr:serine hydrolase [Streptomyces zinciresistens]EGX56630.1 beta-lactamase [Streptomyces zinciresistens K42]
MVRPARPRPRRSRAVVPAVSLSLLALVSPVPPADTSSGGSAPASVRTAPAPSAGAVLARLVSPGGAPAAALLAVGPGGTRFVRTGSGIAREDRFRAGSVTKTFIATVVLQLAAERRLSLSDTVERHLPGLVRGTGGDGRALTLRALLTHTSGLPDFAAATGAAVPLTPRQAVRVALTGPPAAPGAYRYSNTDYVLLGLVIESVTGRSYAAETERRVLAPLGLTGTSFPGSRTSLPAPHGRAYAADGSDVTALDPRVAGASGELVTTLADLDRFFAALLGGRLLPPGTLREMLDTRAARGSYGMGLFPVTLPCGTVVWGHNGRIPGSYVRTAATADGRRVLTFRVNTTDLADPGLEPRLLAAEFCPRGR